MRYPRRIDWLCFVNFLIATASGCQSFHDYRPLPVLVLDAETKKPISEADVRLASPFAHSTFSPYDSVEKTGLDGIARLRAAPSGDHVLLMEVKSKGYMSWTQDLSDDVIRKSKPRGWFEVADSRQPAFVVEMYAEPRFFIDLVVPTSYRGLIKATVQFKEDVPCAPGQRGFSFEVGLSGDVQVTAPSLLLRYTPLYQARFADGTRLTDAMDMLKVGFRWLKREGNVEYFVVGTQYEYDQLRRDLLRNPESSEASAPGSGKGGRKGGRHHGIPALDP
jgi:hypothetical protein